MKKNLLFSMILMMGLVLAGCGGVNDSEIDRVEQNANHGTENLQSNNNMSQEEISEENAKEIALSDAQVENSDVKRIRIERDRDDGRLIYDIDFYVGNKEYHYEVDLYTGEILSRDLDIEDDRN